VTPSAAEVVLFELSLNLVLLLPFFVLPLLFLISGFQHFVVFVYGSIVENDIAVQFRGGRLFRGRRRSLCPALTGPYAVSMSATIAAPPRIPVVGFTRTSKIRKVIPSSSLLFGTAKSEHAARVCGVHSRMDAP
jgi:hypothetical protein